MKHFLFIFLSLFTMAHVIAAPQGEITFNVRGQYSLIVQSGLIGNPFVTVTPSDAGALLTIKTNDSKEQDLGYRIVDTIKANLRNGKNRVFSQDKNGNSYLISSGMRSKPTQEEVMAIMEEVYKVLREKTADYDLTVGKRVTL